MDPAVSPNKTINVPSHLPKIKPPTKNIGAANPNNNTHTIVINKKIRADKNIFLFLSSLSESLLDLIISKLVKSWIEKYLKKNHKKMEIIK